MVDLNSFGKASRLTATPDERQAYIGNNLKTCLDKFTATKLHSDLKDMMGPRPSTAGQMALAQQIFIAFERNLAINASGSTAQQNDAIDIIMQAQKSAYMPFMNLKDQQTGRLSRIAEIAMLGAMHHTLKMPDYKAIATPAMNKSIAGKALEMAVFQLSQLTEEENPEKFQLLTHVGDMLGDSFIATAEGKRFGTVANFLRRTFNQDGTYAPLSKFDIQIP